MLDSRLRGNEHMVPVPTCDIIIPVWNQLALTRTCLDSIARHAPMVPGVKLRLAPLGVSQSSFRVLVIDNGSEKPTREFLKGYAQNSFFPLTLIRNEENQGYLKAVNQGLRASSAPYCLLLNNDTEVGEGWLEEMIAVAESSKKIGIVNPASNSLGVHKPWAASIEKFAAHRRKKYSGQSAAMGHAHGFCFLLKRKVYEELGGFDEVFGEGYYEDFDYSRRAHKKGYQCAVALGAYVFHHEHRSFNLRPGLEASKEKNKQLYLSRHGVSQRILYVLKQANSERNKKIAEELTPLLDSGSWAWFYLPWGVSSAGLPRHSQSRIVHLPQPGFNTWVKLKIRLKKKPFTKITKIEGH